MSYSIDMQEAANAIMELGYRAKINEDGSSPFIESAAHGLDCRIYFYDEESDGGGRFKNYQFEAGIAIGRHVKLNHLMLICNQFNDKFRFLKAVVSLGKFDYVGLQMDCMAYANEVEKFTSEADFFIYGMGVFADDIAKSRFIPDDETSSMHSSALQKLFGLEPDPEAGLLDYMSAAHEGFAGSQNNLGDLYESGTFVPKSEIYAAYWYARAAERGEPTAYLSLATLLSNSSDSQVLIDAAKFAFLAVNNLKDGQNKKSSIAILEKLRDMMSGGDIELAEKLSHHWIPLYQERRLLSDTMGDMSDEGSKLKH